MEPRNKVAKAVASSVFASNAEPSVAAATLGEDDTLSLQEWHQELMADRESLPKTSAWGRLTVISPRRPLFGSFGCGIKRPTLS
jgi:hypothetical protein